MGESKQYRVNHDVEDTKLVEVTEEIREMLKNAFHNLPSSIWDNVKRIDEEALERYLRPLAETRPEFCDKKVNIPDYKYLANK